MVELRIAAIMFNIGPLRAVVHTATKVADAPKREMKGLLPLPIFFSLG
jgi:hypothetical protein